MRRNFVLGASLVVLAALGPGAAAQIPQPPRPGGGAGPAAPGFSPYLNLLRRDSPAYLNYYGLVRPQQEFRQGIQGLQQDVTGAYQAAQAAAADPNAPLPGTGHQSFFQNTRGYFLTTGGGSMARPGGQFGGGMARPGMPGPGGGAGAFGAGGVGRSAGAAPNVRR